MAVLLAVFVLFGAFALSSGTGGATEPHAQQARADQYCGVISSIVDPHRDNPADYGPGQPNPALTLLYAGARHHLDNGFTLGSDGSVGHWNDYGDRFDGRSRWTCSGASGHLHGRVVPTVAQRIADRCADGYDYLAAGHATNYCVGGYNHSDGSRNRDGQVVSDE